MTKDILDLVYTLESELDDAYYSLPDYNANSDSQSYIDGARCTLYHLKDEIEKFILDSNQKQDMPGFEGTMGALESL